MTTTPHTHPPQAPSHALLPGVVATVERIDAGSCRAACMIGIDHPDYEGHFDERPVLPACSQFELLEAIARAAFDDALRFAGAPRCKFLGIISPGDTLTVELARTPQEDTAYEFSIQSQGGPCARGKVHFEAPRRPADVQ